MIKKRFTIIFNEWNLPKNFESGCLMSLAKTTKKIAFKLLLNILPAIEQHVVTNSAFCTESSREMRNGAYIQGDSAKCAQIKTHLSDL